MSNFTFNDKNSMDIDIKSGSFSFGKQSNGTKQVEIGLDLLANPDKKAKTSNASPTPDLANERPVAFNLNDFRDTKSVGDMDFTATKASNMLNLNNDALAEKALEDLVDRRDAEDAKPNFSIPTNEADDLDKIMRELEAEGPLKPAAPPVPVVDPVAERKEKENILYELEKMKRLGVSVPRSFNMSSDIEEMRFELNRIKRDRELKRSIDFQRQALMFVVGGIEWISAKQPWVDIHLDGWSESVNENITDYNDIFEELHEKYKSKGNMPPELRLLFTLAGGAFMFHITNSMFRTSLPGVGDILKQNPELAKQFASAAVNSVNNPTAQQMAGLFGQFGGGSARPPAPPSAEPVPYAPSAAPYAPSTAAPAQTLYNPPSRVSRPPPPPEPRPMPPPQKTNERRIQPPTGIDDILNELKANTVGERKQSVADDAKSMASMSSSGRPKQKKRIVMEL
jgi:hypothetical protein